MKQQRKQQESELEDSSDTGTYFSEHDEGKVIIKNKPEQPKFVDAVLKVM